MLRLTDDRTGRVQDVVPAAGRLLRVFVCAPEDLRTALTADLVRRAASGHKMLTRVVDKQDIEGLDLVLRGTIDVHVGPPDEHDADVRHWVRSAPGPVPAGDEATVRLALLRTHYRADAQLGPEALRDAAAELARWRAAVAAWAEHPSQPLDAGVRAAVLAAFADDLATPRALQLLRDAEEGGLGEGCLFETFAWADQLLGLDLAHDVGKA